VAHAATGFCADDGKDSVAGDLVAWTGGTEYWAASEEVPLYASDIALSWGEFEVVDGMIAIRLTRLG